jgi:hypothetical protein
VSLKLTRENFNAPVLSRGLNQKKARKPIVSTKKGGHYVRQSHRPTPTANSIPAICAMMKPETPVGAIPANVSENERAIVTAGLANEVDTVNQYAAVIEPDGVWCRGGCASDTSQDSQQ